jgi:hypothetical protein
MFSRGTTVTPFAGGVEAAAETGSKLDGQDHLKALKDEFNA